MSLEKLGHYLVVVVFFNLFLGFQIKKIVYLNVFEALTLRFC